MISLLVTVFIIQLACHLVLTIGSKPINDLVCLFAFPLPLCLYRASLYRPLTKRSQLWQLYSRLPFATTTDLSEQIRLRREVVRLKREMNAVSAQDEFSRWAKLRRQHDKALEEHDRKGTFQDRLLPGEKYTVS